MIQGSGEFDIVIWSLLKLWGSIFELTPTICNVYSEYAARSTECESSGLYRCVNTCTDYENTKKNALNWVISNNYMCNLLPKFQIGMQYNLHLICCYWMWLLTLWIFPSAKLSFSRTVHTVGLRLLFLQQMGYIRFNINVHMVQLQHQN